MKLAKKYAIPYFRGVFMRDNLPSNGPTINESMIINLDDSHAPGTHWVAVRKRKNQVYYYDSYGDLIPPSEVVKYLKGNTIFYNYNRDQKSAVECGHLCIEFLMTRYPSQNFVFKQM